MIEVRTLIEHRMETGIRADGSPPPARDMLARLLVRRDEAMIFAAELRNGTSANPYHVFFVRMERTADFEFIWSDETGRPVSATARVTVG